MRRTRLFALLLAALSPAVAQRIAAAGTGNATALQGTPIAATPPAGGNCLVYSASGLNWAPSSCSGTASTAWANLTSGTNTGAAMVVGPGASLSASGSGAIAATTAAALAATPNQCTGGEFATGVTAAGNANCSTPGGGGASSGTDTLQVSNGTGGFLTNSYFKADTANGYFGNLNGVSTPTTPLDVEWTGQARGSTGNVLATFNYGFSSTPNVGDIHELNFDLNESGTSAFNGSTASDVIGYVTLTDTRAPSSASSVGHEEAWIAYENADGNANLICTICAAFDAHAQFGGGGETVNTLTAYNAEGVVTGGSGTVNEFDQFNGGLPALGSGVSVPDVYVFHAGDPASANHGGTCTVALGVGACSAGIWGLDIDSTAPNIANGSLTLGRLTQYSAPDMLDVAGAVSIAGPLDLYDAADGSKCCRVGQPYGSMSRTWQRPNDSGTYTDVVYAYDSSSVTGSLAAQTMFSFPDGINRFFRAEAYLTCTAGVSGSTVAVNVSYGDDVHSQTQTSSAFSCAAANSGYGFSLPFYADSATAANITFSTTGVSGPQYALHVRLIEEEPCKTGGAGYCS